MIQLTLSTLRKFLEPTADIFDQTDKKLFLKKLLTILEKTVAENKILDDMSLNSMEEHLTDSCILKKQINSLKKLISEDNDLEIKSTE